MFRLGVFTITVLGPYITNDSHVKLTDTINAKNAIRFARTVVICLPCGLHTRLYLSIAMAAKITAAAPLHVYVVNRDILQTGPI
jgi:hypothetical protein